MAQALQKRVESPQSGGKTVRPFGFKDKLGYLFGDFGNDFFFILAASFLMVFYTDIFHINPAHVGLLFTVARLWDAFADVTWGRFIDTRKATAQGKFRPWILRMSFPLVIMGILMFVKIPGMSEGFYLAYAYVTYIVWGTLYSTVNIPYGSMASVITGDPVERTSLSSWRTLGGQMAGLIINVVGPIILFVNNKPDANRFILAALIFGGLALACYIACYKLSVERIVIDETNKEKVNFGQTMKGLTKNKPLMVFLVAALTFMIVFMLIGTVNVYLFKDYFTNAKALSIVGLLQAVAVFIAMPFIQPLVKKFGKKEVASGGLLVAALVYGILYFLPNLTATQFIGVLTVAMFGYGVFNLVVWAFVTDVIDYHEYLTGLREDGTVYSIYSMARKIGQAVAGGVGGAAIAAVGYHAGAETQSAETLQGIHTLATLVPALTLGVVFLMIVFLYPLNKKRTAQLAMDLAAKRKS
ncbi:GPH family glycoside/pentoside/hexuronide:cation symporter [Bacillus niacini]|jgi:glycoside/pentoside/hexuronide:cation symporter, GPH family|uniref:GPH family glycoside/pentoside/hexuronide:cation symporter n=1 Tax=Neobacillus niacini TaxID=86668 RepID=A0A852TM88_9BACI|nr:glycoside-pentoside-hexuronide (GPH):cation symporter [Neobacillus niacini]NYE08617.1 GPH family glycoside/pentoside/hexuronide:cation symporter [Neobacillus niacini]